MHFHEYLIYARTLYGNGVSVVRKAHQGPMLLPVAAARTQLAHAPHTSNALALHASTACALHASNACAMHASNACCTRTARQSGFSLFMRNVQRTRARQTKCSYIRHSTIQAAHCTSRKTQLAHKHCTMLAAHCTSVWVQLAHERCLYNMSYRLHVNY